MWDRTQAGWKGREATAASQLRFQRRRHGAGLAARAEFGAVDLVAEAARTL